MDWENILALLLDSVAKAIITIGVPYVIALVAKKVHNDKVVKYIEAAGDLVCNVVAYVDQTYVDALKEDGLFNEDEQMQAFNNVKEHVLEMLNEATKKAIVEMFGDLDYWLNMAIEGAVRLNKSNFVLPPVDEEVVGNDY